MAMPSTAMTEVGMPLRHALLDAGIRAFAHDALRRTLRPYASFFTFQKIGKPVSVPVTYFLKATGR